MISSVVLPDNSRLHAQQNNPLSPSESAVPKNAAVTRLESAVPKSLDLKSFRIRTCEKRRGEGWKLLTNTSVPSQSPKQEVPDRIDQRVHHCRSKDRPRPAPSPSIKQPGNRRQDHIAPIWETHIRNMREPEQHRRRPPARHLAFRRPRQHILQQATEQKFLWPSRETQNRQG